LSDDWDFYFARVNEAVSSIFVDLGIRADAPLENRPWLLWVWLPMRTPKEDGLASNAESDTLQAIGEALDATVGATCGAQLVGRVTGNGRREFYFYAADPGELPGAVETAMKNFPDYQAELGSTFQPKWQQYFSLYPSANNLERMHNRRQLEALASAGDVHELTRKVEHWFGFRDEAARMACRETLEAIEFVVEGESQSDEEGEEFPFTLVMSRHDSIEGRTINGITIELARLAREYQGIYKAWECAVTREEAGG
jgi:hypothetical protein